MTAEEAKKIIENEWECVNRADEGKCDRDCGKCDIVKPSLDILVAYDMACDALDKHIPAKPIEEHTVLSGEEIEILGGRWSEGTTVYECKCGHFVRIGMKHCYECGQAIDWRFKDDGERKSRTVL